MPYLITLVGGTFGAGAGGSYSFRFRIGGNPTNNPGIVPEDYVQFIVNTSAGSGIPPQTPQYWVPQRNYTQLIRQDYVLSSNDVTSTSITSRVQRGAGLLDRYNQARAVLVPLNSSVTQAVADRIADLYLTEHLTAPFSGSLKIAGSGARRVLGGSAVPPHEFLLYAGEKIRLSNRIDPDTGAWGRDGRIAGVTYRHDDRAVDIAIDDRRHQFETILARYAALVGG